jgi:glycogen(starch) synthase
MKIFFSSHAFYPSVGGIETVSLLLAREFTRAGHQVKLVTQTAARGPEPDLAFEVFRRPSPAQLLQLAAWADVVFHNNISLRTAWPLLFVRRPWVVAHHVWIPRTGGFIGLKGCIKRWVLRKASNISISQSVAKDFVTPSTVIPSLYDDTVFRLIPNIQRDRELVFVGRLVSDKGADLLIRAVADLKEGGLTPCLTVVGTGPEETTLKELARNLEIDSQVDFAGVRRGTELATILNRHRIIVIPSLWQEPFGVVALEGIACGCAVVGSEGGGLKDAIGPCGCTFPNGDVEALTRCLAKLLSRQELVGDFRHRAEAHLARHRPPAVARTYLQVFEACYHGNVAR